MKSDLSRDTFDGARHFTRVLMQQGRVTLDSDHNEQVAILLNYLWTLAADVIGPAGAPARGGGFQLTDTADDRGFFIGTGRYYVDGLLVENDLEGLTYTSQPDFPLPDDDPFREGAQRPDGPLLAYLDVWERHITPVEDPAIREVALGGPDTCNRAKLVWQVRVAPVPESPPLSAGEISTLKARRTRREKALAKETDEAAGRKIQAEIDEINARLDRPSSDDGRDCQAVLNGLDPMGTGLLAARLNPGALPPDPCVMPPDSRYRGAENQLYRVEIHDPGPAGTATFKWSRENGSVVAPLLDVNGHTLSVATTRGFAPGGWVELSDETRELQGRPGVLVKLAAVEPGVLTIDPTTSADTFWGTHGALPRVRSWNQTATGDIDLVGGAVQVPYPAEGADPWIDLEDGIQVRFTLDGTYYTGDYWLIPARVATGTIDWPTEEIEQPAHGIRHHFAPLGFVSWNDDTKSWTVDNDCRCEFTSLCDTTAPL